MFWREYWWVCMKDDRNSPIHGIWLVIKGPYHSPSSRSYSNWTVWSGPFKERHEASIEAAALNEEGASNE